jgi:hypothetical protein
MFAWNNRIRYMTDPFTGKLCTQVKMCLRGCRGNRWDTWVYTSDLKFWEAKSAYRPRTFMLTVVGANHV